MYVVAIIYVPILKSKQGERWALSRLTPSRKTKLCPLLELHPAKAKNLGDHIESLCESLQVAWGVDRRFYVDTIWLNGDTGSPAVIENVFESMEEYELKAIPVVRASYNDSSLEQLRAVVSENDRGVLLRITPQILNTPAMIDSVLEAIDVPRNRIDLLLDYGHSAMLLANHVPQVPTLQNGECLLLLPGLPKESHNPAASSMARSSTVRLHIVEQCCSGWLDKNSHLFGLRDAPAWCTGRLR